MEIKALFEILASYMDFVIDFLRSSGMEAYMRAGSVSAQLVSYFIAGVLIAYIIAKLKAIPGYQKLIEQEPAPAGRPQTIVAILPAGDETREADMAAFVVGSFVGALCFHGFLLAYSRVVGQSSLGSAKDTLNAVLAFNAVYHPLNALALKISPRLKSLMQPTSGRGCALTALTLYLVLVLLQCASLYYLDYALAAVHGTSILYMFMAGLLFIVLFFTVLFVVLKMAGLPLRSIFAGAAAGGNAESA